MPAARLLTTPINAHAGAARIISNYVIRKHSFCGFKLHSHSAFRSSRPIGDVTNPYNISVGRKGPVILGPRSENLKSFKQARNMKIRVQYADSIQTEAAVLLMSKTK